MRASPSLALLFAFGALLAGGVWLGRGGAASQGRPELGVEAGSRGGLAPEPGGDLIAPAAQAGGVQVAERAQRVHPIEPQASGRGDLCFLVVDRADRPLPGATARWRHNTELAARKPGEVFRFTTSWAESKQRSDAAGRLLWRAFSHTANEFEVQLDGYAQETAVLDLGDNGVPHGERVIRLRRLPRGRSIQGRVVDGEGSPLGGVEVQLGGAGPKMLARELTRSTGWFGFEVEQPGPGYFLVAAKLGTHGRPTLQGKPTVVLDGVGRGDCDLVLVLEAGPVTRVRFVQGGEDRSRSVSAAAEIAVGGGWMGYKLDFSGFGPFRLQVPSVPLRLIAGLSHTGMNSIYGPFAPEQLGEELAIELPSPALVEGTVRAQGAPLAGARVAPLRGDELADQPFDTTDGEGRFRLELDPHLESVVLGALHEEFGLVRSSAVGLGHGQGKAVELDYGRVERCGLSGRVLLPEGLSPDDVHLTYSVRNGVQTLGPDGRFEVLGLPPGPVRVRAMGGRTLRWGAPAGSFLPGRMPSRKDPAGIEVNPEFVFDLEAGRVQDVELDLRASAPCVVQGKLGIPRAEPPRLEVSHRRMPYASVHSAGGGPAVGLAAIMADGSFAVGVAEPGRYRLRVDFDAHSGYRLRLDVPLWIELGEQAWEPGWGLGELQVRVEPGGARILAGPWALVTELGGGELRIDLPRPDQKFSSGVSLTDGSKVITCTHVPAGTYTVPLAEGAGRLEPVTVDPAQVALFPPAWR